jgi:hypothetical protein
VNVCEEFNVNGMTLISYVQLFTVFCSVKLTKVEGTVVSSTQYILYFLAS